MSITLRRRLEPHADAVSKLRQGEVNVV